MFKFIIGTAWILHNLCIQEKAVEYEKEKDIVEDNDIVHSTDVDEMGTEEGKNKRIQLMNEICPR